MLRGGDGLERTYLSQADTGLRDTRKPASCCGLPGGSPGAEEQVWLCLAVPPPAGVLWLELGQRGEWQPEGGPWRR